MRLYGLLLISLTTSLCIIGCSDQPPDEASEPTQKLALEAQGAILVAPTFYRGDHHHREIDLCTLAHNADRVISGSVLSAVQVLATDCKDESLRAPYRTVVVDIGDTTETVIFPEYHYVHRELEQGRYIHVGVREVDGNKFGMNYVFETSIDGISTLATQRRADVRLTLADVDSLKPSVAGSGCPTGMTDDEFRKYVTNKVEQCSDLVPNETDYDYATDLDEATP